VLIDRSSLSQHFAWVVATGAIAVLASVWYFAAVAATSSWPGGSSLPGFTFGVAGGLICLFEFLLWPRKKLRDWRIGRTQIWMRAHIWLGLLAVPLLIYHSGFRWGGSLSTVLMLLFLVVIASGVWGLVFQQFLPKKMLNDVPAETIYSQIPRVSAQMALEAERLVLATVGTEAGLTPQAVEELAEVGGVTHMVVGRVRQAGGTQGKVLETLVPSQPLPNTDYLATSFRDIVRPYLEQGARSRSILRTTARSAEFFEVVRDQINPDAHSVVDYVENLCLQRRHFDAQERMHFWLHSWLCVHLPLSAALIVLMFVHVWVAIKYW
jgi:hypothetical protein